MAVSIISNNASKMFQKVTGQYTTASWSPGTTTAVWTVPEDGIYIVWMYFGLVDTAETNRNAYRQLQLQTNSPQAYGLQQSLYFDSTGTASNFCGRTICAPLILQQGKQVYPYVHTGVAGIVYDVLICAVKLGGGI